MDIPESYFKLHRDKYYMVSKLVSEKKIPRYYYKYLTDEGFYHFLSSGKVLFAKIDQLNDPFECAANIDCENTYEEWIKFLHSMEVYDGVADYLAKLVVNDKNEAKKCIEGSIRERSKQDGFLCLSSKCDNLLMWAHYTQDHKGVCLEFDILEDLDTFYFPKKVEYESEFISYNYLRDNSKAAEALFRKSIDWEYEDEYRVLKPNGYGLRSVNKSALSSVIFGCRMPEERRKHYLNVLKDNGYAPNIKEAVQSTTQYKLLIQPVQLF